MLLIKQYLNRMHLCVLVIGVAWAALAGPSDMAAQNPNNFDTPNIMQALQTPHSDLVLLSAHRGIHALAGLSQAPDVPENSLQSIDLAAEGGWEMIELDVKSTSDGVPILSHDKSWGREWCGLSPFPFGQRYDPFTPPGNAKNDSTNPLVANTSLSNTRS
jgi:glucosylceramidase